MGSREGWPRPHFRKEERATGQEPRAGRQPAPRQADPCSGETPRTDRGGVIAVKVAGGGDPKWFPSCGERAPGGGEAHEGRGSRRGLTASPRHRTHRGEQGPEGEGVGAGAGQTAGEGVQRHEGMTRPGKPGTAPRRGTIPCRANPGRGSGVKQTRKVSGGASRRGRAKRRGRTIARGVGTPGAQWTPGADVAMRDWNPVGGALARPS